MVIGKIREALEKRKLRKIEEDIEQNKIESYRENEQLEKAESIKKEADRLAHLKQYKTAIDEYNKVLEIYPFNEKEQMFKKPAEFFFKVYFNIAASYSFLNKFSNSIVYFDNALKIENIDDEKNAVAVGTASSKEAFVAFFTTPEMQEVQKSAGVVAPPEIKFLTEA